MVLDAVIETRLEIELEWCEPWPSTGPEGNALDAHVKLRATVHDCVNMARHIAKAHGESTMGNDKDFLLDFIAVHWAELYKP